MQMIPVQVGVLKYGVLCPRIIYELYRLFELIGEYSNK
jgi:hypothetical protein